MAIKGAHFPQNQLASHALPIVATTFDVPFLKKCSPNSSIISSYFKNLSCSWGGYLDYTTCITKAWQVGVFHNYTTWSIRDSPPFTNHGSATALATPFIQLAMFFSLFCMSLLCLRRHVHVHVCLYPRQKEVCDNFGQISFFAWIYSKQQYLPVLIFVKSGLKKVEKSGDKKLLPKICTRQI